MKHILFLQLVLFTILSNAQVKQQAEIKLDALEDYSELKMLDEALLDQRIILSGENHNFRKQNLPFAYKFFRYLHEKHEVNTFVMEFGKGVEWIMQQYIYEGDSVAEKIMELGYYPEQVELVRNLRAYYQEQKDTNPFRVVCVDIDRNWGSTVKAMNVILPRKGIPDSLKLAVESIRALRDEYGDYYANADGLTVVNWDFTPRGYGYDKVQSLRNVLKEYESRKVGMRELLGEDFGTFDAIVEGLKKGMVWNAYLEENTVQHSIYREQEMYQNMISYLKANPDEKAFGQFGRCHIGDSTRFDDCYFRSFRAFAQRLKESEAVDLKDKVFPLPIIYAQVQQSATNRYSLNPGNVGFKDKSIINWYRQYMTSHDKGVHLLELEKPDSANDTQDLLNSSIDYQFAVFNFQTTYGLDAFIPGGTGLGEGRDYYSYFHLEGGYTLQGFNFDELNTAISAYGLENYDALTYGFSVSFAAYEPTFIYGGASVNWWKKETRSTDSLNLDMSGFSFLVHTGYPMVDNKHFQVAAHYNFGWGRMKLEETLNQSSTVTSAQSILESAVTNKNTYTNPAILLGAGLDARVKFFPFSVFVKGGYNFDLSGKKWLSDSDEAVRTSLRSYYVTAGVSLYVGSNI